jgi:hypothetical protein
MPRKKQSELEVIAAPCDDCDQLPICTKHRLACEDFRSFVNLGILCTDDRDATWETYDDIYREVREVVHRGNKHPGRN